ncbi:MAG: acyl-CoA dehydrogenase family protein [Candidatus Helarchaeota archaeon]
MRFKCQAVKDEILEKMNLENRYKIVNINLKAICSEEQMNFLKQVQDFCVNYEKTKNIDHTEDIYSYFPDFGAKGYISRFHKFDEIDQNYKEWGLAMEMMRYLAVDMFDTQFSMSIGATTLAINPCQSHHQGRSEVLEALKDLVTGQALGCILITEPERGSDATHMVSTCEQHDDGSYSISGTKIFSTNGPKAKWAVAYACLEQNKGETMGQFLINTSWDGWNVERVQIPWVPRIWIGKEELKNIKVPKEYVLGPAGRGIPNLFMGLTMERIGIAFENIAECWGALSHAMIYSNMRLQFGKPILNFQGVGFTLADLWSQVGTITLGLLKLSEKYDEKHEKFNGKIPKDMAQMFELNASMFKYRASMLAERVAYECANLMGGAGVSDNTLMQDLLGITRIQEIVGGTRQIQQYILGRGIRSLYKLL